MYRDISHATGLAAHYIENLSRDIVLLQSCRTCPNIWHYPRPVCPACGSREFDWIPACGNGTIVSFTIVRHAPSAEFKGSIPYVVALVDLAEGARMTGIISGDKPLDIQIDDRIKIEIPRDEQGSPGMPVFWRHST